MSLFGGQRWCGVAMLALLILGGCKESDGDRSDGGDGDAADTGTPQGDDSSHPTCVVSTQRAEIAAHGVDKVDLLFVIGDTGSMAEEQVALRAQFPRIVSALTSGDLTPNDGADDVDFAPVKSVHLGVVSSDLGAPGVTGIPSCSGLGDDGVMNNVAGPDIAGCSPPGVYPRFLTHTAQANDPLATANDLACVASVGLEGCQFAQPLESGIKALWPSDDPRITFLPDPQGFGATGHGDATMGGAPGTNAGFLRSDPAQGLSLVALVVVTDAEDCSSKDLTHFRPASQLNANDPADLQLMQQGLGTRCNFNSQNLYLKERYINGLKALRPQNEELVVFAAIVGVPPETVAEIPDDIADNDAARAAFYAGIRAHPSMQPVVDTLGTPTPDDDVMRPSCDTASTGKAFAPHRILDVAEGLAGNGVVQSICQSDLGPAFDAILRTIGRRLGAPCLPHKLARGARGTVDCDVVWALPTPGRAQVGTPTVCAQAPYLLPFEGDQSTTAEGGERCRVVQLAVQDGNVMPTEAEGMSYSEGWYYDDFSEETARCVGGEGKQRIAFSPGAMPPAGVRVTLECASQVALGWTLPQDADRNAEQPALGDPCATVQRSGQTLSGDAACAIRLATGQLDESLFCDPRTNSCAQSCDSDGDCPAAWTCDDSASTRAATGDRSSCVAACGLGPQGASAKRVGAPCFPEVVPQGGYDPREAYVSTGHADCGGGVCLVYHLEGDPSCRPQMSNDTRICAEATDVESRVYCSCRCDAPDGAPECACPDGFTCVQALDRGPDSLRGGYCARNSHADASNAGEAGASDPAQTDAGNAGGAGPSDAAQTDAGNAGEADAADACETIGASCGGQGDSPEADGGLIPSLGMPCVDVCMTGLVCESSGLFARQCTAVCSGDAACQLLAAGSACLGTDVRQCGLPCTQESACPDGTSCQTIDGMSGCRIPREYNELCTNNSSCNIGLLCVGAGALGQGMCTTPCAVTTDCVLHGADSACVGAGVGSGFCYDRCMDSVECPRALLCTMTATEAFSTCRPAR